MYKKKHWEMDWREKTYIKYNFAMMDHWFILIAGIL